MNTKPLAFGIIGFLLGGFVVSVAATYFDSGAVSSNSEMSMSQMNEDLANKKGDEFDKAFISHMIEHHQGAIDMAKLADKNAKHSEVKALSREIIAAQQSEISEMKQWQADWGYDSTEHDGMNH